MSSRTLALKRKLETFIESIDSPTTFTTQEVMELLNYRWGSVRSIAYVLKGNPKVTYLGARGYRSRGEGEWLITP